MDIIPVSWLFQNLFQSRVSGLKFLYATNTALIFFIRNWFISKKSSDDKLLSNCQGPALFH